MKKLNFYLFVIVTTTLFVCCESGEKEQGKVEKAETNYCQFVNPFIGTGGDGHTYPGVVVPFGMVQVSPDTEIKHYRKSYPWCSGYRYEDKTILGFSHTHMSGAGHSDFGDVLVIPTVGKLQLESGTSDQPDNGYRSRYSHDYEEASPGYYSVDLLDYNVKVELSASRRSALHRYTFPKSDSAHILIDLIHAIYNHDEKVVLANFRIENDSLITGYRQTHAWLDNKQVFFAIQFSKPFDSYGFDRSDDFLYGSKDRRGIITGVKTITAKKLKAYVNYKTEENEQIMIKVGISQVSTAGALNNLEEEIPHWNFEKLVNNARNEWEKELSKFAAKGDQKQKEIFYTSVYHLCIEPMTFMDVDRKYRGVDNNIHVAENYVNYANFSIWDTYRATHPLYTFVQQERTVDFIKTMLNFHDQSVYKILPTLPTYNEETWCMIGYHAVPIIIDAYMKGIRDYDVEKAYQACINSATEGSYEGLEYYMELGFIPMEKEDESVSKVLEYAYDDWTIAQFAKSLGKEEDYKEFTKRSQYYRNMYDPQTKFMRAKNSDGIWGEPFDPLYAAYWGDYTEGNAWQYSWYVPHDVPGLIELMGGNEAFTNKLDSLFIIIDEKEQHKNVEDISGLIGQYAHGNEPCHHVAYLYPYAGQPWKTQKWIQEIVSTMYDNTPFGLCGNEDRGQMSAWYLFTSMGFYPVCPGSNEYIIGRPCLPEITMHMDNGNSLTIIANDLSDENMYIQSLSFNDKPYNKFYLKHEDLAKGGKLIFQMGPQPNKEWGR